MIYTLNTCVFSSHLLIASATTFYHRRAVHWNYILPGWGQKIQRLWSQSCCVLINIGFKLYLCLWMKFCAIKQIYYLYVTINFNFNFSMPLRMQGCDPRVINHTKKNFVFIYVNRKTPLQIWFFFFMANIGDWLVISLSSIGNRTLVSTGIKAFRFETLQRFRSSIKIAACSLIHNY